MPQKKHITKKKKKPQQMFITRALKKRKRQAKQKMMFIPYETQIMKTLPRHRGLYLYRPRQQEEKESDWVDVKTRTRKMEFQQQGPYISKKISKKVKAPYPNLIPQERNIKQPIKKDYRKEQQEMSRILEQSAAIRMAQQQRQQNVSFQEPLMRMLQPVYEILGNYLDQKKNEKMQQDLAQRNITQTQTQQPSQMQQNVLQDMTQQQQPQQQSLRQQNLSSYLQQQQPGLILQNQLPMQQQEEEESKDQQKHQQHEQNMRRQQQQQEDQMLQSYVSQQMEQIQSLDQTMRFPENISIFDYENPKYRQQLHQWAQQQDNPDFFDINLSSIKQPDIELQEIKRPQEMEIQTSQIQQQLPQMHEKQTQISSPYENYKRQLYEDIIKNSEAQLILENRTKNIISDLGRKIKRSDIVNPEKIIQLNDKIYKYIEEKTGKNSANYRENLIQMALDLQQGKQPQYQQKLYFTTQTKWSQQKIQDTEQLNQKHNLKKKNEFDEIVNNIYDTIQLKKGEKEFYNNLAEQEHIHWKDKPLQIIIGQQQFENLTEDIKKYNQQEEEKENPEIKPENLKLVEQLYDAHNLLAKQYRDYYVNQSMFVGKQLMANIVNRVKNKNDYYDTQQQTLNQLKKDSQKKAEDILKNTQKLKELQNAVSQKQDLQHHYRQYWQNVNDTFGNPEINIQQIEEQQQQGQQEEQDFMKQELQHQSLHSQSHQDEKQQQSILQEFMHEKSHQQQPEEQKQQQTQQQQQQTSSFSFHLPQQQQEQEQQQSSLSFQFQPSKSEIQYEKKYGEKSLSESEQAYSMYSKKSESQSGDNRYGNDDDISTTDSEIDDDDIHIDDGLDNKQIHDIMMDRMKNIRNPLYKFLGVFRRDDDDLEQKIMQNKKYVQNGGTIMWVQNTTNKDDSNNNHWYSVAINHDYNLFDSQPIQKGADQHQKENMKKYLYLLDLPWYSKFKYNTNAVQPENSNDCALFSILFLLRFMGSNQNYDYASMRNYSAKDGQKIVDTYFYEY